MTSRARKFSDPLTLRGVPCRQAPCSMMLPDNRRPLASSNLESSTTKYPHPGTAYSKPALPRRVSGLTAMNGVTFRWYHFPAGWFSTPVIDPPKQAAASSSPNTNLLTKQRAPRSQERAGTKVHIPFVHEVLGRCPGRIFLSDDKLKIGERKLLEQRL